MRVSRASPPLDFIFGLDPAALNQLRQLGDGGDSLSAMLQQCLTS